MTGVGLGRWPKCSLSLVNGVHCAERKNEKGSSGAGGKEAVQYLQSSGNSSYTCRSSRSRSSYSYSRTTKVRSPVMPSLRRTAAEVAISEYHVVHITNAAVLD